MGIISYREVIPRAASHRFGESPNADIKYVVTVDEPTPTQTIINAIGIFHGASHPEFGYLRCLDISANESDRHHVEVTYRYEVPKQENVDPNPLARPDIWTFATGGAAVPALYYYAGDSIAPLVNSAGDLFEGLTTTESELRATITGNRPTFDYALAANVTNCLNNAPYLGGPAYTWLCTGITGQQQVEVVNNNEIRYWTFTTELVYRQSTHLLFLPDVGFNFIAKNKDEDDATEDGAAQNSDDPKIEGKSPQTGVTLLQGKKARTAGGVKKRAWVIDPETKEKIPSANVVALNPNGSMKPAGAAPNILVRRVHRIINFSEFFGTPQF